jgi:two-component system OmpR family response regulator/two-component system response regulator RstA
MNISRHAHIFIVEDDAKLNELTEKFLRNNGFSVSIESDGNLAVSRILAESPDLVILDVMLPGKDGRTICRELRPRYDGVIVMVTALNEDFDQIAGLEIGADDYIIKPIHPRLLLSRIQALLRLTARSSTTGSRDDETNQNEYNADIIVVGALELHPSSRTVKADGRSIDLTTSQFDLFYHLARHAGQIISRDRLYQDLYGIEYDGFNRSIDVLIRRLREKIGDNGRHPHTIKSIRGKGYMVVKPS